LSSRSRIQLDKSNPAYSAASRKRSRSDPFTRNLMLKGRMRFSVPLPIVPM